MVRSSPLSFFVLVAFIGLSGCATSYENTAVKSWDLMRDGHIDNALDAYKKDVTSDKEALLRLMDEGILLRVGRRFEESNKKFFAADKIIEMNGYVSLGEQAATLVTNEKMTTYQGEDFEKVLIHLYLGLNYLDLQRTEEALIETRRVNEILYKMISEAKRPYELNAFARYMGALLFEQEGEENDAYIALKNTLKIDPSLADRFQTIGVDLLRLAKRMGFTDDFESYQKQFGKSAVEIAMKALQEKDGAVVLLFESGKSPKKYSSKERKMTTGKGGTAVEVLLPVAYYEKRNARIQSARLKVGGQTAETVVLNDVERTAIQHLNDRMGRAMAKALATAAVKAGIATGIGKATNSSDLGLLIGLGLFLTSEADTRSWLLLPRDFQVAKVYLRPGTYSATLEYLDGAKQVVRSESIDRIDLRASKNSFIQRRSFE